MELVIGEETFQYPNEINSITSMFNELSEILRKNKWVLKSLSIDDQEIEDQYYVYVEERIEHIGIIRANVSTLREVRDDSIISMEQYLTRAIPHIEHLAGGFYQGGSKSAWEQFAQLTEALQWIISVLGSLNAFDAELSLQNKEALKELQLLIEPTIHTLGDAVGQADTTYLGDILIHEVMPLLSKLHDEVNITQMNEVVRHDLN